MISTTYGQHDRYRGARRLPATAVLLVAAVLRTWRRNQNGYDNEYYAAAVRSMSGAWHNFLYNSFDPAGFVSVDKPPVALWIQVASVDPDARVTRESRRDATRPLRDARRPLTGQSPPRR